MSIRSFMFCDVCNPKGVRCLEMRRNKHRGHGTRRRWSDGRAWIETTLEVAVAEHGWVVTTQNACVCPDCYAKLRSEGDAALEPVASVAQAGPLEPVTLTFCDICNPQGLRCLETRRRESRMDRSGRRFGDSRAWHEGDARDAIAGAGWAATEDGRHICPQCQTRHPELTAGHARPLPPRGSQDEP